MILLCPLCACISYADCINMSLAIISMSETYSLNIWQQYIIFSPFFLDYIPMQIGSSGLCRKYGGKKELSIGEMNWTIFKILTPINGEKEFEILSWCGICVELFEYAGFSPVYYFLSALVPTNEGRRAVELFLTGAYVETVELYWLPP